MLLSSFSHRQLHLTFDRKKFHLFSVMAGQVLLPLMTFILVTSIILTCDGKSFKLKSSGIRREKVLQYSATLEHRADATKGARKAVANR